MTQDEYLAFERGSDSRHEYFNGETYAMSGASGRHNMIVASLIGLLYAQLRQRPCRIFPSDMRVKTPAPLLYTYPDITVTCGEPPRYEDVSIDTLLNPSLIVEVLSPSTEHYDRGMKFECYRSIPSLREYLLVAQDRIHVEHYLRQNTQWVLTDPGGPDSELALPSIECSLLLSDIYEQVSFDNPQEGSQ
ncbi:MAG: Uma2 family endonuclease [Anaerolineae bacterium]|nr:Uma2 family endonuclease [Anaerolineae bacterium]